MTIDVYSATGSKNGTVDLPETLFGARINHGLMHQAVVAQQSNRRTAIAHTKNRGEVQGSTRKLYAQKHTGRARRGSIRSPLLRGGGKAFGSRNNENFIKDMPKSMRRAALFSCLSWQAKKGAILGLEEYPDTVKTKQMHGLLTKLPVDIGRKILIVLPARHKGIEFSTRNIQGIKTITAAYLNPEDILNARHIIFVSDSIKKADEIFGTRASKVKVKEEVAKVATEKKVKKTATKKSPATKTKKPTSKSDSSAS